MEVLLFVVGAIVLGVVFQRTHKLQAALALSEQRLSWAELRLADLERKSRPASPWQSPRAADTAPAELPPADVVPADAPPPAEPEPESEPEPEPEYWSQLEAFDPAFDPASEPGQSQDAAPPPPRPTRSWSFEQLFGAQLPVWGGGIALALAGFFLVKYSIDIGLITPRVRVVLGAAFGLLLIGTAQIARAWSRTAADPRIGQALAGSGIAVLYAVAYLAARSYALITPATGFAAMAITTAAALALALRHGPPTAVLGLLGGFATPALVASDSDNVPILLGYLLLTVAGLLGLAGRQGWRWLAALALAGGFGWTTLLLIGDLALADLRLTGLFLAALAAAGVIGEGRGTAPAPARSRSPRWLLTGASTTLAFAQLAFVVGKGGFGLFEWGLYALLGAGTLALGIRMPRYRLLPLIGLAVGLATLISWPAPPAPDLGLVAAGATLLFAPIAYLMAFRQPASLSWPALALAATLAPAAIAYLRLPLALTDLGWAGIAAALAIAPLLLARRHAATPPADIPALLLFGAAAVATLLLGFAITQAVPSRFEPLGLALLATAVVAAARTAADARLGWLALFPLLAGLAATTGDPGFGTQLFRLGPEPSQDPASGLILWLAPGLALAAATRLDPQRPRARLWAAVAGLLLAIGIAQLLPADWRPTAWVLLALALAEAARRQTRLPFTPGAGLVLAIPASWALVAAAAVAIAILGGVSAAAPILIIDLPSPLHALQWLILPGLGLLAFAARGSRTATTIGAATLAAGVYVLLRQPLAIATPAEFIARGLPERTVITLLLVAAAALVHRLRPATPLAAQLLAGLAVTRFVALDLFIYNPVLVPQAVGDAPLANWLFPAFALPALWIGLLHARAPDLAGPARTGLDIVRMAAVLAFALLTVRQLFQGSILAGGEVSRPENYGYSLAAILVALAFLAWGARHAAQAFRIGSLVLLLGAVGKVFLSDAAALDGLLRIASFLGLGITLIGVSWFFTRHVFPRSQAPGTGESPGLSGPRPPPPPRRASGAPQL